MMSAIRAGQLQQDVTLIEKNPILGKKLLLSGKGRCNLTNACDLEPFLERFSRNGQFLRDAFKKFFNQDLMHFFESRGLKLKIERQLRVFPVTDRSNSILEVLRKELLQQKVKILYKASLKDVVMQNKQVKGVLLGDAKVIPADKVILATGGATYKFTGSDGQVLEMASRLGHKVVPLRPGLVPLEVRQGYVRQLEGVALKNIRIKFSDADKQIISDIGELIFTGFGISGPLVLTLSGQIVEWLHENRHPHVEIDLKPALTKEQLHARLLREFKLNSKKTLRNTLKSVLPLRLVDTFITLAKIAPMKKVSQVTQAERDNLIFLLKAWRLDIIRARPLDEAIVTRGGVSLKEIDPRTMESRLIKGLYFAGEMIDVDADTGGFNLQAAFSTGYLAGESASAN